MQSSATHQSCQRDAGGSIDNRMRVDATLLLAMGQTQLPSAVSRQYHTPGITCGTSLWLRHLVSITSARMAATGICRPHSHCDVSALRHAYATRLGVLQPCH